MLDVCVALIVFQADPFTLDQSLGENGDPSAKSPNGFYVPLASLGVPIELAGCVDLWSVDSNETNPFTVVEKEGTLRPGSPTGWKRSQRPEVYSG